MAFYGLFIGVDRYASSRISWLTCAVRDAEALRALFLDNFGGNCELLTDQYATRFAIDGAFQRLSEVKPEDTVVIYYSGHGSDTHEIVTYDADIDRLSDTAIPLKDLLEWFKKIPSKKLFFILDCCFSGGIGAKCLHVENRPRDIPSAEDALDKLSGEGRIIITAASANQLAWESSRFGHGFLTHHLIEGLKGAEEVLDSGRIAFYKLMEYLSSHVTAAAASIGKEQHPNVRWTIDEAIYWPIFKIGDAFKVAFPEAVHQEATTDLKSLSLFGFPDELIKSWSASIPFLNQLQVDAINQFGILDGKHVIVSAPTSSGKTMVGELAALSGILRRKRAIFLFPLKALVNDKQRHFDRLYESFGLRTIKATGDSTDDIPLLMRGQYDICLMTYEKFTALVLANPHILEQIGTVVIDEVQMIADKSRGINLEFILTLLRIKRRQGIEPQLIALSAVIGDTNGFEHWLDARLLKRTSRPIPIDEGVLLGDGSFKSREDSGTETVVPGFVSKEYRKNGGNQEWIIPLVRRLVSEGKQVIVFRETTGEARGTAGYLADALSLPSADDVLKALPVGDPSIMSEALRKALGGGVALHTSNLDRDERVLIEEYFRRPDSKIRVIAATTTLAMGVNTPAEAVIIVGLQHPGDPPAPYSVAEYKNMVGRAGRLGFAEHGVSFLLALSAKDEYEYWNHYVFGEPEDLVSRFLSDKADPRSLIIRVLVSAKNTVGDTKKKIGLKAVDIIDFLEGSFGAFLQKRSANGWRWDANLITEALNNLEGHELIKREADDVYQLTELGWIAGHGGVEVETVTRLVDALRPLDEEAISDPVLIAATQLSVELDDMNFPVSGNGTKESSTWDAELQTQSISSYILNKMRSSANDTHHVACRMKKTAACLLWISNMSLEEIESILTRHGGKWDGIAGPVRRIAERTHDLLHIAGAVAQCVHPGLDLSERMTRLFVRLEIGLPSSLAEIGKIIGSQLSRGDYRQLADSGLSSLQDLESASDELIIEKLNEEKLVLIKEALRKFREQYEVESDLKHPLIPIYEP